MQDKPKILLVGAGPARTALALALSMDYMEIITPEQVKERSIQISELPKPTPYVIQPLPEIKNLIAFKEEKNYITGKKLPKKKRRK